MKAMSLAEMSVMVPTNAKAIATIHERMILSSKTDVESAKNILITANLIKSLMERVIRLEGYIEGHDMRHTVMAEVEMEKKAKGAAPAGLPGLGPKVKPVPNDGEPT